MYGDNADDLFRPNTFRTGDAEQLTPAPEPVRFEQLAFDHAMRDLQSSLPGPSWARQYPVYLRTIRRPERPVQLMVEDRAHRRPAVIEPQDEPFIGTPIEIEARALIIAFAHAPE